MVSLSSQQGRGVNDTTRVSGASRLRQPGSRMNDTTRPWTYHIDGEVGCAVCLVVLVTLVSEGSSLGSRGSPTEGVDNLDSAYAFGGGLSTAERWTTPMSRQSRKGPTRGWNKGARRGA
jgi:hypothetical protein